MPVLEPGHNRTLDLGCCPCPGHARLREAEAHLWALVVWFGSEHEHPYINRDLAAAARYVKQHLSAEDMTARHRAVIAQLDVTPEPSPYERETSRG